MDLKFRYVNSTGDKDKDFLDLSKPPFIGELSNNLFNFKWDYITQGQAVQKIVKFEKYMIEKTFHVLISGSDEREYYNNLERFLHYTDVDINNLKMGKLYVGDYYLECYIFSNLKPKQYLYTNKTLLECHIICERGNWQKEKTFIYRSQGGFEGEQQYTGNGIFYPYDYIHDGDDFGYDYSAPFGQSTLKNESYLDADFELTLYGAMNNPKITIGGNVYEFIDCPINADEYIKINSQKKTAILHHSNGTDENIFRKRNKEHYIYQKIKGGGNLVILGEDANADITLFLERSEPKWSENLWI